MTVETYPPLWTVADIPDQTGRLAVVTGANGGIGEITARELARRGAHVVLACRNAERGQAAINRLRSDVPKASVETRQLDLASLSSIHRFAGEWDGRGIDLLINNAGIAMVPFSRTVDGFESQFGVNHLGTFSLTGLLMPYLLAAPDPRVVTVSSEGQRGARFDLDNLDSQRKYNPAWAYWQSKKANVYFATQLQRWATSHRLPLRSMVAVPGLTKTTVLSGGANAARGRLYQLFTGFVMRFLAKPVEQGAWSSLYAATVPDLLGGSYIAPSGPFEFRGTPVARNGFRAVYDAQTARELWRVSEELTAVEYPTRRIGQ